MNNASDDEHPGGIYLEARLAKKKFLFGRTFFSIFITNVFCAEMRVGHACICPRTDTWLAGFEVIPPQKQLAFPRMPKNANSGRRNCCRCFCLVSSQRIQAKIKQIERFLENFVTPISMIANNKRSCSLKIESNFRPRLRFSFPGFFNIHRTYAIIELRSNRRLWRAKKRVGHACICPTMVTGQPVLKLYPPPKNGSPAANELKIPSAKLLWLL